MSTRGDGAGQPSTSTAAPEQPATSAPQKRGRGRPRKQPQEPTGEPSPKRPRGRPRGSKNKSPSKAAQKFQFLLGIEQPWTKEAMVVGKSDSPIPVLLNPVQYGIMKQLQLPLYYGSLEELQTFPLTVNCL
uniref:Uncharacterized protein n=1 Tax=Pelusios castaneus TaxID=367368 RepID=A0A8C8S4T3_9SAUR